MFKNLRELVIAMKDEDACRDFLAKQRWEDGKAICPYCGYGKCYNIEKGKRYKCGNKECYKKFSVIVGTIFEDSNVPLSKWFTAVYLATAHKKGISSYQLGKDIGVSQKCAWFMLHRIREIMKPKEAIKLDNIVEIDEVYIGGRVSKMSNKKRKELKETNMSKLTKSMVMGMVERGGNLKLIHAGHTTQVNSRHIQPILKDNIDKDAVLLTDMSGLYNGVKRSFAGHETVNHEAKEFARDSIHTNTIEGAFSQLKRSILGIYHHVTIKHLSRYCEETAFRYNLRKMKDADRFTESLKQVNGRLSYKMLTETPLPKIAVAVSPDQYWLPVTPTYTKGKRGVKRAVLQILDGEVIGRFESVKEASNSSGLSVSVIHRACKGERPAGGGFIWRYEEKL